MLPKAKYRKDYKKPDYTISDIFLEFQLDAQQTKVTAKSLVHKLNPEATKLHLDGQSLELVSIKLNDEPFSQYEKVNDGLILDLGEIVRDKFELEIVTLISPAKNTSLQGLYQSGEALCTQCEAEGFRQITYMLDRPDVLARYSTRIIADKAQYPILLSMVIAFVKVIWIMDSTGWNGKIRSQNRAIFLRWWQVILMCCVILSPHVAVVKWHWNFMLIKVI